MRGEREGVFRKMGTGMSSKPVAMEVDAEVSKWRTEVSTGMRRWNE